MTKDRLPLINGTELEIGDKNYRILDLMSASGGSCLVYMAETVKSERPVKCWSQKPDSSTAAKVVIKEFYPKDRNLSWCISRGKGGALIVDESILERFNHEKMRFTGGIARQVAVSYADYNASTLGKPEAYTDVNGTAYSILKLGKGTTLKDADRFRLSVCEISQIMASLCREVIKLHIREQLYLDIKPSNVFLFDAEEATGRRVALFDFDTVFEKDNLPEVGFYSDGWSPSEQCFWSISEINEATDAYAIGAVFYWLLTGEKVDDKTTTRILCGDFSFLHVSEILTRKDELIKKLKRF